MEKETLDRVMKRVFYPDMEMGKQLNEYRVEYQVLQEEMLSVKPQIENMEKLELLNKQLTQQNSHLNEQFEVLIELTKQTYIRPHNWSSVYFQIAMANLHRMETTRAHHQSTVHRLESQNRSLEVTITTMGSFIQQLIESKADIEIPGDVRRIVSQLSLAEKRRNNNLRSFQNRIVEDNNNKYEMKKSNSAGKDARLVKTNSMIEPPYPLKSALSQPNLGSKLEKVSSFFANSHNHIKQQRAQMAAIRSEESNEAVNCNGGNDENDPKNVNIDIQITDTVSNSGSDPNIVQNDNGLKINTLAALEKSVSLPKNAKIQLKSSKSAYELGKFNISNSNKIQGNLCVVYNVDNIPWSIYTVIFHYDLFYTFI